MFVSVRMQFHNHVEGGLKHVGRMWPTRAFCAARRADPANNIKGDDFSNIWKSSLITALL